MDIVINGKTISNESSNHECDLDKYLYEEKIAFASIEKYSILTAIENCNISLEANEQKEHTLEYKIGSLFINMMDNFYRHIVTFTKNAKDLLTSSINKLTKSSEIKDVRIKEGQEEIEIEGVIGLVKKTVKVSIKELYKICGLVDQNGKNTMVKFMEKNVYLQRVKNLSVKMTGMVNIVCSELTKPNSNEDLISSKVAEVENEGNSFKNDLFIRTTNVKDVVKNFAMFGKNPTAMAKDISISVLNETENFEKLQMNLYKAKENIKKKSNASKSLAQIINKAFTSFQKADKAILNSSSGFTKIAFEFMAIFNREAIGDNAVSNALSYMDRSIHVVQNGTDNFAISFKKIVLDSSTVPEKDLKILIDEGRAINAIVNEGKGQVIDKNTGKMSSENEHVMKFMEVMKKYSRKIKAVVGQSKRYVIYNFNISIEKDKYGKEYVVVSGDIINDNAKQLENIPDILYHTANIGGLKELMPTAGNVSTGSKEVVGGIHGIGISTKRVYAAKSPVFKQGYSLIKYVYFMEDTLAKAEQKMHGMMTADRIKLLKEIGSDETIQELSHMHIYMIKKESIADKNVFADPEHHGGLSGATSLKEGVIKDNLVYIETDTPIPVTEITDAVYHKLKNRSKYKTIYQVAKANNLKSILWIFTSAIK